MKIAVCFSGQPRYYNMGIPFLLQNIFHPKYDIDYFGHLWWDRSSIQQNVSSGNGSGWETDPLLDKKISNILSPKNIVFEKPRKFSSQYELTERSKTRTSVSNIMSHLYSLKQCGNILEEYIQRTSTTYDLIIFARSDFFVTYQDCFFEQLLTTNPEPSTIHVNWSQGQEWNKTHLNDQFLTFNDFSIAKYYSELFDHFEQYWLDGKYLCIHRMKLFHMKKIKDVNFINVFKEKWGTFRDGGVVNCYGVNTPYSSHGQVIFTNCADHTHSFLLSCKVPLDYDRLLASLGTS